MNLLETVRTLNQKAARSRKVIKKHSLHEQGEILKQAAQDLVNNAQTVDANTRAADTKNNLELVLDDTSLTVNGKRFTSFTSIDDLRSAIRLPDEYTEKISIFKKLQFVSIINVAVQSIVYMALLAQKPDTNAYLLRNYPGLTAAHLFGLLEIGEGRMHPKFLTSDCPLYKVLLKRKASIEVQNIVARNTATLLVPVIGIKNKVRFIETKPVAVSKIKFWQAEVIVKLDGTLETNPEKIIERSAAELQKRNDMSHKDYFFENGLLHVGNHVFNKVKADTMLSEFYAYLGITAYKPPKKN